MAQAPTRLTGGFEGRAAERPRGPDVDAIEDDLSRLRRDARRLYDELSDRVARAFDVKARLREHRVAEIGLGAGVLLVGTLVVVLRVRRARQERRIAERVRRRLSAMRTALADPGSVHRHPVHLEWGKVLTALIVPAATVASRLLVERLVEPKLLLPAKSGA